jgi:Domain of unknown function (DUF4336)
MSSAVPLPENPRDWRWPYWPLLPLYPYGRRRTLRREVVPETIWVFEQLQGILYVTVPIRMTVVRLAAGGLCIYAPIAPTRECLRLLQELVERFGAVKFIVLTTLSGLEHKVYVAPFARHCPQALVYVLEHQWSFPVNLPLPWLGLPTKRTQILPIDAAITPLAADFEYAILGPISLGLGPFGEVAFYHRSSRSLLVTDTIVSIPATPPEIVALEPYPLLFHAKENALERAVDTPANRAKGWQRSCLFAFYFRPQSLLPVEFAASIQAAKQAPDRSRQAYFGWFPFGWQQDWQQSFTTLAKQGQPQVAPILQTLILNRGSKLTLSWVEQVAGWPFERIIPCHLQAPIASTPAVFRAAFDFLQTEQEQPLVTENPDYQFLALLDAQLSARGITPPKA